MKKGKDGKKTHTKELLATLFAVVVLGFLYLYILAIVRPSTSPGISQDTSPVGENTSTLPTSVSGMKKYRSDFMKIEFEYTGNYVIEEKVTSVILKSNDVSSSEILFSKYGTNFENVKSHVDDAVARWKNKPTSRYRLAGLGIDGEVVNTSSDSYSVIYFVKDYAVYQFETGDPSLFSDLETIAKSFRIID